MRGVIEQLSTNREFGRQFHTNDEFWENVNEIIQTLKPIYIATKDMQNIGYGLADFYVSLLRIEKNLCRAAAIDTLNLATHLIQELNSRKADLLQTPSMISAIYLDPRIKFKLTSQEKELAKLHLLKLYKRIEEIKTNGSEISDDQNNTLDELNEEYAIAQSNFDIDTSCLLQSLAKYEAVPRANLKDAIMDFWNSNKEQFPLIYRLACIIHAIPAGQCFEERNFSSFSYIRNAKRTKLNPTNVKNILTVRLNKEIFYANKQKKISNILNGKKVD